MSTAEHLAVEAIRAAARELQIQIDATAAATAILTAAVHILRLGEAVRDTHPTA